MPVAILGMSDSEITLIAHALQICGLPFPANNLETISTDHDAEDAFAIFNQDIIQTFGGDETNLPELDYGWSDDPRLHSFQYRAKGLRRYYNQLDNWGWVGSRTGLTLEFWQKLFPDLRVIVCIRNPLETLAERDEPSEVFFERAVYYNARLLTTLRRTPFQVVHFQALNHNPVAEVQRLAEFCGIRPKREQMEDVLAFLATCTRYPLRTDVMLASRGVPDTLAQQYHGFCMEAGEGYARMMQSGEYQQLVLAEELKNWLTERSRDERFARELQHAQVVSENREAEIEILHARIQYLNERIANQEKQLRRLYRQFDIQSLEPDAD